MLVSPSFFSLRTMDNFYSFTGSSSELNHEFYDMLDYIDQPPTQPECLLNLDQQFCNDDMLDHNDQPPTQPECLLNLDQQFCNDDMLDNMTNLDACASIFESDQPLTQSESESKLKRNSPSETNNPAERKRLTDRAYRKRRKELVERTKEEVDYLRNEMERLAKKNEALKMEVRDKNKSLQSREEMMKQLQKNLDQMKTQNRSQSVLVRVISEQLYSDSDVDRRQENAILKKQIEHLMNLIVDPSKFEFLFKLQQEKVELERETRVLKVTVEALCEKIYHN